MNDADLGLKTQMDDYLAELFHEVKKGEYDNERQRVELPLAEQLISDGHKIKRQVKCTLGRIDILDYTTKEIIECKKIGTERDLFDAARQLRDYRFDFPDYGLVIAVTYVEDEAEWFASALRKVGFKILRLPVYDLGKPQK